MIGRRSLLAALGMLAQLAGRPAAAQPVAAASAPLSRPSVGDVVSLGQDRYQVGRIVVDKRAGSFVVPGRLNVTGKPLEYLATAPRGMKAYESLLELDVTGSEFNLACILIGLDREALKSPWRELRRVQRIVAQKVSLYVAWVEGGKRRQVPAAEALLNADSGIAPASVEWVYTGAPASEGRDRFVADETGTLIGFVHDVNTIIESAETIGVGAYGSVRGHASLPPVGTAIELIVEAGSGKK